MTSNNSSRTPLNTFVTRKSLVGTLRAHGVCVGDLLMVHSSLSAMGWVCGGVETLVGALMDSVGAQGTLVMPAMTSDNTDPAHWENPPVDPLLWEEIRLNTPAFDHLRSPATHVGVAAEYFRTLPGVRRSQHPTCSVSAWGAHAERITANHPLEDPFGEESPFARLVHLQGKILLIGVGYDRCSVLHLAEMRAGAVDWHKEGSAVLDQGERQWIRYRMPKVDSDRFPEIAHSFEKDLPHAITHFFLGEADGRLFKAQTAVGYFQRKLSAA